MSRPKGSLRLLVGFGVAVVVLSVVTVAPTYRRHTTRQTITTNGGAGSTTTTVAGGGARSGPGGSSTTGGASAAGLACERGRNGGRTDKGVYGDRVKLAANIVQSGVGASFLGPVRFGMQAVINKVNRAGGICGRLLDVTMVDDGWRASDGAANIVSFIHGDYFAIAVNPSSEGLRVEIDNGDISRARIPVIGSDGMLIDQYRDPWVWPVAASTTSTMHVMAADAVARGAKTFGIVYESTYHFGIEGAKAFNSAVRRLTGKDIPGYSDPTRNPHCEKAFCGIVANQSGYSSEVQTFNGACGVEGGRSKCDFVALLLEPATAENWISSGGITQDLNVGIGGPQPLFTNDFAIACGAKCDGMWVWTGYNPPIYPYKDDAPVSQYVRDVKATNSQADVNNSFLEGGYLGMQLVAKAIEATGPLLTREGIRRVLDSMTFNTGLSGPLKWRAGNHFANITLQAFSIQAKPSFAGWRYEQTGLTPDRWPGEI